VKVATISIRMLLDYSVWLKDRQCEAVPSNDNGARKLVGGP
jgi:hypothetical protein